VRQLVHDLGGEGSVSVKDGAVIGINIAGMLRQIMTLGLDTGATQQQRTDFAEAGASFRVENGVVRTDDLHLNAPVLRLEGAGAVDLPKLTIDMRVTPKLASTLEGQDASGEPVFQAGIPFVIQGPYASPSVRFDLGGTLTSAIEGPEDVARLAADLAKSPEAVDTIRKQFDFLQDLPAPAAGEALDALKGVIEGGAKGEESKQPDASDLGNAAKGLLKGLTGQ
jgi:AsmA protein